MVIDLPASPQPLALQQHAYIQELLHGSVPEKRPDFGDLSDIINFIETTVRVSGGNARAIHNTAESLANTHPALAPLIAKEPPEVEEPQEESIVPTLPEWGLPDLSLGMGVSQWFDEYVAFSKRWSGRATDIQHKGCALWLLSTIAARRVAIHYGGLQYTPLYIALVAPSSVYAKSKTAQIATDVLYRTGLDWFLGSSAPSPEKLLSNMAAKHPPEDWEKLSEAEKEFERRRIAHSGQVSWYYSEFGNLIREMANDKGRNMPFKGILQRLDDGENHYDLDTFKRGRERIEMPYLALLGTMTPDCMRPYSNKDASSWGDGFYARFAFCCPPAGKKKTREDLKRERFPYEDRFIPTSLYQPLQEWHERLRERPCEIEVTETDKGVKEFTIIRGEYPVTEYRFADQATRDALDNYGDALDIMAQEPSLGQYRSCYARLRDKALRIAVLIASFENSPTVKMEHVCFAIGLAEELRASLHNLDAFLNQDNSVTEQEEREAKIIAYVKKYGPISAAKLREKDRQWKAMPPRRFRSILEDLAKAGEIHTASKGKYIGMEV